MILLTGGSACGKSSYAEGLCMAFPGPRYYLAAMRPAGEGGMEKIARHRAMRAGKGFETIERYTGYDHLKLPRRGTALLECICNLTANEMFDERGNITDPVRPVLDGVEALERQCDRLIVITNDVGSGGGDYEPAVREYVRALGEINAALARRASHVYELMCGIPLVLKGELLK